MTASLKAQLAELAELAPRVHATTDRVNALVARMEGVLVNDLAVGLEAETKAFDDRTLANKSRVAKHLCLGSIGDQDQIHVIERIWKSDGLISEERIPWSACPRGSKLKAIAVLPELVANLVADAKKLMDEANETANKVAGWISGEETAIDSQSAPVPSPPASSSSHRRSKK